MEKYLLNKVAVVTGASRGIGRAEALALALRGAAVLINYHKNSEGAFNTVEEIKSKGGQAIPFRADVSKAEEVGAVAQAALDEFGQIDILVNNAGIAGDHVGKPIVDTTEESWDAVMAVHLKGTFLCTKYMAPTMMEQRSGKIINTASVHGQVGGRPGFGNYGAAKAGVIALTKTCARELAPYGILVNAVSLGYVDTDMLRGMPPDVRHELVNRQIPLRRLGRVEEIGELVSWLASPLCSYMTGSVIEVNAGRTEYLYDPLFKPSNHNPT